MLDTNLPIPSGDFFCLWMVGAGLGRLLGHAFILAFPGFDCHVASFALCGAAALAGASTQTISSAVITIEMSGPHPSVVAMCVLS